MIIRTPAKTSFQQRMDVARPHEQEVISRLACRGWMAEPFGQSQLTRPMRDAIRKFPTPLRWLPDVIAVCTLPGREGIRLVDAKSAFVKDTPNYCFEKAAVDAAEMWKKCFGIRTVFVMYDFTVVTPDAVSIFGDFRDGSGTKGSGTPFYLLRKVFAGDFDQEFGSGPKQPAP